MTFISHDHNKTAVRSFSSARIIVTSSDDDDGLVPYHQSFNSSDIFSLQRGPKAFMLVITAMPDTSETSARIVHSQPLPMALMSGAAIMPPTQEKMLRMKLLHAIPIEALPGRNSVSMVVAMAKTIMLPQPKKKLAIICIGLKRQRLQKYGEFTGACAYWYDPVNVELYTPSIPDQRRREDECA